MQINLPSSRSLASLRLRGLCVYPAGSLPWLLAALLLMAAGCTPSQLVVRGAMPLMAGGDLAMNRETDLQLARDAIPATIKLLEGMLVSDPDNSRLRIHAAQAFYGYGYSFVEREDPARAARFYRRCVGHAKVALKNAGLAGDVESLALPELRRTVAGLGEKALPGLFWTASCMAKLADVRRTDPATIAKLGRAALLMERVLELDETYYHGGPHLFFGVYYGGRAPMVGGDFHKAERHFARAREITGGRLLIVDLLYAEYLARQRLDRESFHTRLTRVIEAPADLFPDMALANAVAQDRARHLLRMESEWF